MTPRHYGQNPCDVDAVLNAIGTHINAQPQLHWAVLLDTAFDYESQAVLGGQSDHLNCYAQADALDDLEAVAPCLVPIAANSQGQARCAELLAHASGRPMLSVLASTIALPELVQYWHPLHWVYSTEPQDSQRFLLRFADTRISAALPQQFTPAQWNALRAPLAHWFIVSRLGELQALPAAKAPQAALERFDLSPKVLGKMADAAIPDTLLDMVSEEFPELIPAALPPFAIYQNFCHVVDFGTQHGVDAMVDLCTLAIAALQSDGRILQSKPLIALLSEQRYNSGCLSEAMEELAIA